MKIATINEVDFSLFCSLLNAYLNVSTDGVAITFPLFNIRNAHIALLQFAFFIISSWFILSWTDECIPFSDQCSTQQTTIYYVLGIRTFMKILNGHIIISNHWRIIHKRSILRAFEFYICWWQKYMYLVWAKTTPEWIEYQ